MFPFPAGMTFPRNQWYVAAWSREVGHEILGRTLLGQPVVLYRSEAGQPIALDGRCPHRRFPLANGRREGDNVVCGYHGLTFNTSGKCVRIPSQERVPDSYCVRTYPVCEKWSWIWIWMGDASLADENLIPDHSKLPVLNDEWLSVIGGLEKVNARYTAMHDNLLDLSHLTFLHDDTIGSPAVANTEPQFKQTNDCLEVARYVKGDEVDHLPIGKALSITAPVDRDMVQQFFPPGLHVTGSSFRSAAVGGSEPGREYGSFRVLHGITPETETTTHYFWAYCRNFRQSDESMTRGMNAFISSALEQDKAGVAGCEQMMRFEGTSPEIHTVGDGAALRGRRLIENQMRAELSLSKSGSTTTKNEMAQT